MGKLLNPRLKALASGTFFFVTAYSMIALGQDKPLPESRKARIKMELDSHSCSGRPLEPIVHTDPLFAKMEHNKRITQTQSVDANWVNEMRKCQNSLRGGGIIQPKETYFKPADVVLEGGSEAFKKKRASCPSAVAEVLADELFRDAKFDKMSKVQKFNDIFKSQKLGEDRMETLLNQLRKYPGFQVPDYAYKAGSDNDFRISVKDKKGNEISYRVEISKYGKASLTIDRMPAGGWDEKVGAKIQAKAEKLAAERIDGKHPEVYYDKSTDAPGRTRYKFSTEALGSAPGTDACVFSEVEMYDSTPYEDMEKIHKGCKMTAESCIALSCEFKLDYKAPVSRLEFPDLSFGQLGRQTSYMDVCEKGLVRAAVLPQGAWPPKYYDAAPKGNDGTATKAK